MHLIFLSAFTFIILSVDMTIFYTGIQHTNPSQLENVDVLTRRVIPTLYLEGIPLVKILNFFVINNSYRINAIKEDFFMYILMVNS